LEVLFGSLLTLTIHSADQQQKKNDGGGERPLINPDNNNNDNKQNTITKKEFCFFHYLFLFSPISLLPPTIHPF
jgi:hypothetical protein